ncbi:MarR family winged helix-turn-helix transcriptional regulator [Roseibium sp. MMSF_3544]|uniref:MarR family winged helix-turn-helix transcriptional regulator n=1 Tax=unclassified Roseibium TaxID=2629323 RepID=UPI00273EAC15|nr:MarR family transcriptional regulator [Roseibium sp. MMSF_3544]
MNETTNQMSLLDAIGFSAPGETQKSKKDPSPTKKKPLNKSQAKKEDAPQSGATDKRDTGEVRPGGQPPEGAATGTSPQEAVRETAPHSANASAPPEPLHLDDFLCFALYSANHAMHGVYKDLLKEIGLTYPQFLAMTVLWEKNNVPVGTITSKLQLDTNTLTPLLKRLEAMGLLTRTRNSKDERQVILKLTRKGRELRKKTERFSSCVFSASGLTTDEIMDLQAKIMKLRDNLRKSDQS